jgi:hypothetical protein
MHPFFWGNFHTMAFENKEELGNFCFFRWKTLKKAKESPMFQIHKIESKNTCHT